MNQTSFGRKFSAMGVSAVLAAGSLFAVSTPAQAAAVAKPIYISFEANDANASVVAGGAFEGASAALDNVPGGGNGSGKGLKFTKTGNPWSGVNVFVNRPERFTNAANKVITFDYFSPDNVASPVMVKLQDPGGAFKAVMAQPGWNSLSFDMSSGQGWSDATEYKTMAIFPNFGADNGLSTSVANNGQVYFIDNISVNGGTLSDVETSGAPSREATSLLLTFEDNDTVGALATGTADGDGRGSFEGAGPNEIADAPAGGFGGKALKFTKTGNPWSGFTLIDDATGTNKFGSTAFPVISTNFYNSSSSAIPVMLKLENGPANARKYAMAEPGWSTLTWDMSDGANGWDGSKDYIKVVVFPNFADGDLNAPAAAPVEGQFYYFDDFAFNGATTPEFEDPRTATSTLVTFEDNDTTGYINVAFEGASSEVAMVPAGGNGGKGLKITRTGGQVYAGVNVLDATSTSVKYTSGSNKIVTMNFYTPKAVPVMIQLKADGSQVEQRVNAPAGWSVLTFDFGATPFTGSYSDAAEYTKVALFPDFGTVGTGEIFYVDNIAFNGATTPSIPVVPPVKASQTIGKSITTMRVGKIAALPLKTNKKLNVRWVSKTPAVCSVFVTSGKVKAKKVGICKLVGTNAGNSSFKAVTVNRNIKVIK